MIALHCANQLSRHFPFDDVHEGKGPCISLTVLNSEPFQYCHGDRYFLVLGQTREMCFGFRRFYVLRFPQVIHFLHTKLTLPIYFYALIIDYSFPSLNDELPTV